MVIQLRPGDNVFCVFAGKSNIQCLSEKRKDAISGFLFRRVMLKIHVDRRSGKTKHRLISYFLSNTSAKNCNRIVYDGDYSKSMVGSFFLGQCSCDSRLIQWVRKMCCYCCCCCCCCCYCCLCQLRHSRKLTDAASEDALRRR